jgi:antitoxin CptB
MDLILGHFADRHLAAMDRGQLERYGWLLESSDPAIYEWLTGQRPPPELIGSDLWRLLAESFSEFARGLARW